MCRDFDFLAILHVTGNNILFGRKYCARISLQLRGHLSQTMNCCSFADVCICVAERG